MQHESAKQVFVLRQRAGGLEANIGRGAWRKAATVTRRRRVSLDWGVGGVVGEGYSYPTRRTWL